MQPIISARGLTRVFGSGESAVTAVDGVDLDVYAQEFLSVTGRSGSGKTTLLNLMAGLDRPTAGTISAALDRAPPGLREPTAPLASARAGDR